MHLGIIAIALPITIIGTNFSREYEKHRQATIFESSQIEIAEEEAEQQQQQQAQPHDHRDQEYKKKHAAEGTDDAIALDDLQIKYSSTTAAASSSSSRHLNGEVNLDGTMACIRQPSLTTRRTSATIRLKRTKLVMLRVSHSLAEQVEDMRKKIGWLQEELEKLTVDTPGQ